MLENLIRPINNAVPDDPAAERHEVKVQTEINAQFLELKRQARGTFEAIKGRRGATNEAYWQEVVVKAKLDYDSGNFLMGRIGACRQLDLPLVAALLQLRQELLGDIDNPTASDKMLADTAIVAYQNFLRIQGVIGSLCLEFQRDLFGQRSLDAVLGPTEAAAVVAQVERLEQTLMPALDRAHRMLIRTLDRLEARKSGKPSAAISIGSAGQVNVASNVQNLNV